MPTWCARGRTAVSRSSVDFAVSGVPVEEPPYRAPLHTMTLLDEAIADGTDLGGDGEVCFRLPDGSDQEELSDLLALNEAEALTGLLCRCVQRLGPHRPPDREQVSGLSVLARAEIEERMRQVAPKVEQSMAAACVGCGRTFVVPFDVQRFLLGELRTDSQLLYQEVHYLAFHYHWSEHEIMGMRRDKRRTLHRRARRLDRGAEQWRLRGTCAACWPTAPGRSGTGPACTSCSASPRTRACGSGSRRPRPGPGSATCAGTATGRRTYRSARRTGSPS